MPRKTPDAAFNSASAIFSSSLYAVELSKNNFSEEQETEAFISVSIIE